MSAISPVIEMKQVLAEDAKIRNPVLYHGYDTKTKEYLYNISLLDFTKKWLYEIPTISNREPVFIIKNSKTFREFFRSNYKFFGNINFDNIIIAGGSVTDIMMGKEIKDFDLFIYGIESTQKADNLIYDTVKTILTNLKTITGLDFIKTVVINTKNSLTLEIDATGLLKMKIQFIYRLYHTKLEVLAGFDIGASATGYDGCNVWTTRLGKFALEYGVNIVDLTRRSTTYEHRLIKYLTKKNFRIVMEKFDFSKLDLTPMRFGIPGYIDMPYFKMTVMKISYNNMEFRDYQEDRKPVSDYEVAIPKHMLLVSPAMKYSYDMFMNDEKVKYNITYISMLDEKYYPAMFVDFKTKSKSEKSDLNRFINNMCIAYPTWKTENVGSQLSGSFNPIISDPADWYGKYLSKEPKKTSKCVKIVFWVLLILLLIIKIMPIKEPLFDLDPTIPKRNFTHV